MPHGYGVFPVAHIFTVLLVPLGLPALRALSVLPGLPALTALSVLPDPLGLLALPDLPVPLGLPALPGLLHRLFTHNIRNLPGVEYVSH